MKIEALPKRVVYRNNPLAEVVCQIRIERLADFDQDQRSALQSQLLNAGYSNVGEEISFGFVQQLGPVGAATTAPVSFPQVRIDHYSSADGVWRVSASPEFVALACVKYSGWDTFLPRLQFAAKAFVSLHTGAKPVRLGLRYKDVIEREPLELTGVPWHELIKPFLLGPLAPDALADGQTPSDDEVGNFLSQTLLRLDAAMVLLQSSLLTALDGRRKAFLIDADFFNEGEAAADILTDADLMTARLQTLHSNAGALFHRGITLRLHDALRPIE